MLHELIVRSGLSSLTARSFEIQSASGAVCVCAVEHVNKTTPAPQPQLRHLEHAASVLRIPKGGFASAAASILHVSKGGFASALASAHFTP